MKNLNNIVLLGAGYLIGRMSKKTAPGIGSIGNTKDDVYLDFHNKLVKKLKSIKGIEDVNGIFENPTKYGNIASFISFKCKIKDRWNYTIANISLEYNRDMLFISGKGYIPLKKLSVTEVLNHIKSYYKI